MFDWIVKTVADASGVTNQLKIAEWARLNRTNPFDMGAKNYQRCIHDLGLGGKYYELEYNEDQYSGQFLNRDAYAIKHRSEKTECYL
ncbi:hypothetical protein QUA51_26190, partial [Microcoleus sp. Pol10_D6]